MTLTKKYRLVWNDYVSILFLTNIMVGSGRTANKRVDVYNCQRTGSSDAAYNALVNDGWAVNGITRI